MLKFILHNLRGLLRFSGRDRRELFWPWVATLIVAFMAMTAAVMVPMMFNMMDRMQAFAVALEVLRRVEQELVQRRGLAVDAEHGVGHDDGAFLRAVGQQRGHGAETLWMAGREDHNQLRIGFEQARPGFEERCFFLRLPRSPFLEIIRFEAVLADHRRASDDLFAVAARNGVVRLRFLEPLGVKSVLLRRRLVERWHVTRYRLFAAVLPGIPDAVTLAPAPLGIGPIRHTRVVQILFPHFGCLRTSGGTEYLVDAGVDYHALFVRKHFTVN